MLRQLRQIPNYTEVVCVKDSKVQLTFWRHHYSACALKKMNTFKHRSSDERQKNRDREIPRGNLNFIKYSALLIASGKIITNDDKKPDSSKPMFLVDKNSHVVIRVWLPNIFDGSVGHVSLQTFQAGPNGKSIYASYWPKESPRFFLERFKPLGKNLTPSPEADIFIKKRNPDKIIVLYSLDVDKINNAFNKFKESSCNWCLLASSWFAEKETQNCSGLVGFLLKEGEIDKLVNCHVAPYYEGTKDIVIGGTATIAGVIPMGIRLMQGAAGVVSGRPPERPGYNGFSYEAMLYLAIVVYGLFKLSDGTRKLSKSFLITTPGDIAKLSIYAQEYEKRKYAFTSNHNEQQIKSK